MKKTEEIEELDILESPNLNTPLHQSAFNLSDDEKIAIIEKHFSEIMTTLGLDLTDDSLQGTPKRVAKMFVKEIFQGLKPENLPEATLFDNKFSYKQMLVEKNITLTTTCEHHFLPIVGKAHVAYISSGQVIGLSKLNRIVRYFAKRPQVQERLTIQIADHLCKILQTDDVAVIIDAVHYCVISRGIEDVQSSTVTAEYRGKFAEFDMQNQVIQYIHLK